MAARKKPRMPMAKAMSVAMGTVRARRLPPPGATTWQACEQAGEGRYT